MEATRRLSEAFMRAHPASSARVLERFPVRALWPVLASAPADAAAATLRRLPPSLGAECLAQIAPGAARIILGELPLEFRILLLRRMDPQAGEALLGAMSRDAAEPLRRLLEQSQESIEDLVDPFAVVLPEDVSVAEALQRVRRAARGVQFHLYVVDREHVLVGMISLHTLVRARRKALLRSVMGDHPPHLEFDATRQSAILSPLWDEYSALPVVDRDRLLLGVIQRGAIARARHELAQAARAEGGLDAVLALGELYWRGLLGVLEGMAGAPSGEPRAGGGKRRDFR